MDSDTHPEPESGLLWQDGSDNSDPEITPLMAGLSETATPRLVADRLPWAVWLVTAVEVCDKFAFFGLGGPLQNYLQNSRGDRLHPGVIGE
ncbi:hypothetical protein RRF57_013183 [Xylaria bambusicola]|uniref:Uncharacterized protein n=1 Tax=Xylaria bambusicola TaxID=326684 RepID=A0AAN7UXR8_9PEZI